MVWLSLAAKPPRLARDLLKVPMMTCTLVGDAEVLAGAGARLAQHADGVGVVHHDGGVVLGGQGRDAGQVGDVARHAEDAVDGDQLARLGAALLQAGLQGLHVVMVEAHELAEAQQAAVDDAGVVLAVGDDVLAAADQGADDAQVGLEAGGVEDGGLLADQGGQLRLQLQVDVQRAVEEARAGAAAAVLVDGRLDGLLDLRVVGQAEVAVGAHHDDLAAIERDLGILRGADGPEVGIEPRRPDPVRVLVLPHLVEQWQMVFRYAEHVRSSHQCSRYTRQ